MGGGTIFKAVTKEDMHGIKLIYPDQNITGIYQSILKPIFSQLEILQSKIDNLCQTRDLLLPKLISGEIDVENMDIDIEEMEA